VHLFDWNVTKCKILILQSITVVLVFLHSGAVFGLFQAPVLPFLAVGLPSSAVFESRVVPSSLAPVVDGAFIVAHTHVSSIVHVEAMSTATE